MASHRQSKPRRIHLVLDWDGTLTMRDTMSFLSKLPVVSSTSTASGHANDPAGPQGWDDLVAAYLDDFRQHQEAYTPAPDQRLSATEESKWLASLKGVEGRSAARALRADFFKGTTETDLHNLAKDLIESGELQLRDGWDSVLLEGSKSMNQPSAFDQVKISILSINWSAAFIRHCLLEAARSYQNVNNDALTRAIDHIEISANEFVCGSHPSTGSGKHIMTSDDKHSQFRTMTGAQSASDRESAFDNYNIYVGDSSTDFDCILDADVGVCVQDIPLTSTQAGLTAIFARLGIQIFPLSDCPRLLPTPRQLGVWRIGSLSEICTFLDVTAA
ncbi:hypothetical protein P152DRAFT_456228 [Eremomyces bilateralis CBS 781.70]|uniref:HAD-like protein n=1 Tax=Eremomyces bilateralis CBS 781.70 TaxID=1392243 RepID=A0A6G1GAR1_9PEZI|nr:uncharacterized protein P152DRAFT_456228 [Eremomyces bilateralis CBS 781.70]KAF1815178.1 hypothetical protein P152DRAFT_456228 [Eremomyces bilateralis CBS 781.70]